MTYTNVQCIIVMIVRQLLDCNISGQAVCILGLKYSTVV